jgi:3-oxoacyl-[acyl-carrier-protein] synthase-3
MKCQPFSIRGIVSAVPQGGQSLLDLAKLMPMADAEKIAESTGIRARRLSAPGQTTADLATAACRTLLSEMGWEPEEVGLVLSVTQTPDYRLPSNAHLIHRTLGLPKDCICVDTSLGCSGYVFGLWQAGQLLSSTDRKKALLVVGDTTSSTFKADDRAIAPLFGDAAAATALEWSPKFPRPTAVLGSDGTGAPYLIQKQSGNRQPGDTRSLFMDGTQVFAFTLREVPQNVRSTLDEAEWSIDQVDYFVMHQANAMMMTHLAKKMGVPLSKLPMALEEFGNTSSASIPLCMTEKLAAALTASHSKLLLSGFGVGWSWGSIALEATPLAVCKTIQVHPEFRGAQIPGMLNS